MISENLEDTPGFSPVVGGGGGGGRKVGREARWMNSVTPHLRCEGCLEAMPLRLAGHLWTL